MSRADDDDLVQALAANTPDNHVKDLVSVDFFVVPTVTFKVLFVFIVLAHARRRIVHYARNTPTDFSRSDDT